MPRPINVAPTAGGLGITDPLLIRPGSKERSVLWERLRRLNADRMPPLASVLVDDESLALIGKWIDSLNTGWE